jgi:hypothetical protein
LEQKMAKNRLALFLYCLSCPAMLCGQTTTPVPDSLSEPAKLTLPNGTPVLLRFAQPVVGLPQNRPMNAIEHAKVGDRVRLVVSSDIRAHDVVVVKKGCLAQATVTKVDRPSKYSESGLQLRFDWIQSVNEQEIPIRQKRKGDKSNKFTAIVFTTSAGTYVGFGLDHRTFSDAWRRYQMQQTGQQWTVVPPGTRIRAYVQGDFVLDSAEVSKALAAFPAQNPTATVTIYREKGPPEQQPQQGQRVQPRQVAGLHLRWRLVCTAATGAWAGLPGAGIACRGIGARGRAAGVVRSELPRDLDDAGGGEAEAQAAATALRERLRHCQIMTAAASVKPSVSLKRKSPSRHSAAARAMASSIQLSRVNRKPIATMPNRPIATSALNVASATAP